MNKTIARIGWYLMTFLAGAVAVYAFAFLFIPGMGDATIRARFWEFPLAGFSHVFGGGVALLLGPFQLSKRFRNRNLNLHRWTGRVYLVAVLFAGLAGLYIISPLLRRVGLCHTLDSECWPHCGFFPASWPISESSRETSRATVGG